MVKFITSKLLSEHGVPHAFFTRKGGVSSAGFASLNCSVFSRDDKKNIESNLKSAAGALNFSFESLYFMKQIHSNIAHKAENNKKPPKGDVIYTDDPSKLIGVYTADCVPILIYAKDVNYVVAIHAGWRGALNGVISSAISELIKNNSKPENMIVAIGPCIRQQSYVFGQEVIDLFIEANPHNKMFFDGYKADIPGYCKAQLSAMGVDKIDDIGLDTYTDSENFFSYRRYTHESANNQDFAALGYGAQLSAIALPKE